MASPQAENGHTQIANEILEQLAKLYLSPNQWQVVIFIIRKTYGFKKKVDYIANSQVVDGTGLSKPVVSRALKGLQERNIITRHKRHISFQKDWELWKLAVRATLATKLPKQATNKSYLNRQPKLAVQSSPPSPLPPTPPIPPTPLQNKLIQKKGCENFYLFWKAYPKKVAKPRARKAFDKINPDDTLLEKILAGVARAKKTRQWVKDSGEYIPHPATWLNAKRWEDEIEEVRISSWE